MTGQGEQGSPLRRIQRCRRSGRCTKCAVRVTLRGGSYALGGPHIIIFVRSENEPQGTPLFARDTHHILSATGTR